MGKNTDLTELNLVFYEEAVNDYNDLDGSQKVVVMKALQRIEEKGQSLGDTLGNKGPTNLSGYRKVKIKKEGIRIVYSITNSKTEITEIVAIGNRSDSEVYEQAYQRIINRLKKDKKTKKDKKKDD